jgi:hypothetical protein
MKVIHSASALRPAAWRTGSVTPPTSNLKCARRPRSLRGRVDVINVLPRGDAPDNLIFNLNRFHGPPSGLCKRHQVSSPARQVLVFIPVRSTASQTGSSRLANAILYPVGPFIRPCNIMPVCTADY